MVTVTHKAKTHLMNKMLANDKKYILLQAKGGGCAGFKYDWSFPDEKDINQLDMCIDISDQHKLVIDRYSEFKILGCEIDYAESISGSTLEIINPNAKATCGCGESFS
tara:strand:- start:282 stop:605 length:324 start_codon:yes stop_codon:yes gene_type:complete